MDVPSPNKLSVGMGLGLFLLALTYSLTDIGVVLDKNAFVGKYTSSIKYALTFFFGFVTIVFKIMVVLLFIYTFIVIYNIVIVGILKPLMSKNTLDPTRGFSGARDIITQAHESYFGMIKSVATKTMDVVFGFINIPNTLILFFIVIPIYLLFAVFSYYQFVSTKQTIDDDSQKGQKIMNTNYHYFIMLIFTVVITFALYIIVKTLLMLSAT